MLRYAIVMVSAEKKVNKISTGNLRMLCWQRGYKGVVGLARKLKRSRVTVHRAVKRPHQFGPTYQLIEQALNEPKTDQNRS